MSAAIRRRRRSPYRAIADAHLPRRGRLRELPGPGTPPPPSPSHPRRRSRGEPPAPTSGHGPPIPENRPREWLRTPANRSAGPPKAADHLPPHPRRCPSASVEPAGCALPHSSSPFRLDAQTVAPPAVNRPRRRRRRARAGHWGQRPGGMGRMVSSGVISWSLQHAPWPHRGARRGLGVGRRAGGHRPAGPTREPDIHVVEQDSGWSPPGRGRVARAAAAGPCPAGHRSGSSRWTRSCAPRAAVPPWRCRPAPGIGRSRRATGRPSQSERPLGLPGQLPSEQAGHARSASRSTHTLENRRRAATPGVDRRCALTSPPESNRSLPRAFCCRGCRSEGVCVAGGICP